MKKRITKTPIGFTIANNTIKQIEELAELLDSSKVGVVEKAVDRLYYTEIVAKALNKDV